MPSLKISHIFSTLAQNYRLITQKNGVFGKREKEKEEKEKIKAVIRDEEKRIPFMLRTKLSRKGS